MVDYLEFHIGKRAIERVIFISLIIILLIISMFAFRGKGSCSEVVCEEINDIVIEEGKTVEPIIEEEPIVEQTNILLCRYRKYEFCSKKFNY